MRLFPFFLMPFFLPRLVFSRRLKQTACSSFGASREQNAMASLANQRETYARKSEHLEIPENSFSEFQVKNIDKIHERANARVSLRQSGKGFDSFAPSLQVYAIAQSSWKFPENSRENDHGKK
mmetsp:Transcript_978/g.2673  ORF Transcript_978/g.2673 Transcript_978/m.2673 type:complete len:123 (-) Transcript_978:134-502(-)